jgi:hypothetical protein
MKRISKVILITLLTAVMAMGVCGCSTADTVNYNLNKEANENNVFYHCAAGSKHFEEIQSILSEEQFRKATSEYFQFPTEEELE